MIGCPSAKKMNLDPYLREIYSKLIRDVNIKLNIIKIIEGIRNVCNLE